MWIDFLRQYFVLLAYVFAPLNFFQVVEELTVKNLLVPIFR